MNAGVFITHQPVLNKQRAITANRIVVHARGAALGETGAQALNDLSAVWPGERTVFVGFAGAAPDPGLLQWPAPQNVIFEIPAAALNSAATMQVMQELQQAGATLCLDGYVPTQALPQATSFRFVITDVAHARSGTPPGLVLARDLADSDAFEAALKNGFDGATGWFFLRTKPKAKKLAPSHGQIIRLLNLVRKNAEIPVIEAALKQDVALSFKLLRYINSAGFGLSCEIQSFRHAVTILGYDKLNKWLSLLLVTASKDPTAPALMQAAVVRGRFMEIIGAGYFEKGELDNLFITGAFSLLDVLLGTSMEGILDEMSLPESVTDALMLKDSVYKPFLELAVASESDSDASLASIAASLQLEVSQVNRSQMQALSFADSLQYG